MTNLKLYGGTKTGTDHKLFKKKINIEWFRHKIRRRRSKGKVEIAGFHNELKTTE